MNKKWHRHRKILNKTNMDMPLKNMTREEELKLQADWLSKNKVTTSIGRQYFKTITKELIPEYCKNCPWWESESTVAKNNKCRLCQ